MEKRQCIKCGKSYPGYYERCQHCRHDQIDRPSLRQFAANMGGFLKGLAGLAFVLLIAGVILGQLPGACSSGSDPNYEPARL
jgi:hypothetical protein